VRDSSLTWRSSNSCPTNDAGRLAILHSFTREHAPLTCVFADEVERTHVKSDCLSMLSGLVPARAWGFKSPSDTQLTCTNVDAGPRRNRGRFAFLLPVVYRAVVVILALRVLEPDFLEQLEYRAGGDRACPGTAGRSKRAVPRMAT
jgi:hypothetical protein